MPVKLLPALHLLPALAYADLWVPEQMIEGGTAAWLPQIHGSWRAWLEPDLIAGTKRGRPSLTTAQLQPIGRSLAP